MEAAKAGRTMIAVPGAGGRWNYRGTAVCAPERAEAAAD
ncbi:hypothetical protein L21SP2_1991 [Salinispira pacifica]|uniref:Uncharacterized protein n=1 Tax=Salinispira pacifica TaxID=1307761 RepID=V5WHQ7_9SPIO|nr:hypothetical protein L21SP2_1991 [Salinispira pacifica]